MEIFEEYKPTDHETKLLTFKQIINFDKRQLKNKTFVFAEEYCQEERFFSIKINQLVGENENEVMISIVDNSDQILRNNEKEHNELLVMINATVSHELRNPLNSIVAFNI